jgi:hypothetical protein
VIIVAVGSVLDCGSRLVVASYHNRKKMQDSEIPSMFRASCTLRLVSNMKMVPFMLLYREQ